MTDFGKTVKHALIDRGKTQKWLIEQVREKTGMYFDRSYYSRITTGTYINQKMVTAIKEILHI